MVVCIDTSSAVWTVIEGANALTGGLFLTLLLIMLFFFFMCFLFRLSLEWSAIFILPLNLGLVACDSTFMAATGVLLIYLGVILGKNFLFIR